MSETRARYAAGDESATAPIDLVGHATHRLVLAPYGVFGLLTRVVLLCQTCDEEVVDVEVDVMRVLDDARQIAALRELVYGLIDAWFDGEMYRRLYCDEPLHEADLSAAAAAKRAAFDRLVRGDVDRRAVGREREDE
jgi:hypothetical protein